MDRPAAPRLPAGPRRWTEEELVPNAPGQVFATWFARNGHHMFDRLEPAWLWWSAQKPEPEE